MFRSYVIRYNLQLLSYHFRAYMPEGAVVTRHEITKGEVGPVIAQAGAFRALSYARFGFLTQGYELAFQRPKERESYCFARAEDVHNSKLYADALTKRRFMLIPANEFNMEARQHPVSLSMISIFAFGAIYNVTARPNGKELSFCVLTCPCEVFGRRPIILTEHQYGPWLTGRLELPKAAKAIRMGDLYLR